MIDTPDPDTQRRPGRSLQFGLRTLIVGIAVVALFIIIAGRLYEWRTSIPLSQAVDAFNMCTEESGPQYGDPLSEDEVVTAIESQLPTLNANAQVTAILTRIRIPNDASFEAFRVTEGPTATRSSNAKLWGINLTIMTGPKSGYGLRIRETEPTKFGYLAGLATNSWLASQPLMRSLLGPRWLWKFSQPTVSLVRLKDVAAVNSARILGTT